MCHQGLGQGRAKAPMSSAWGRCFVLQGCLWDPRRQLRSRRTLHLARCPEAAEASGELAAGLALSADPCELCWEPGPMRAQGPPLPPAGLRAALRASGPQCDLPPSAPDRLTWSWSGRMPAGLGAAGGRTPGPGKQQVWQAGPELMVTGTRQTATAEAGSGLR